MEATATNAGALATTSGTQGTGANQMPRVANSGGALTASASAQPANNTPLSLLNQPAVKRSMPAIIVIATLFAFALMYSWIQGQNLRTVYPGMSETDRHASFEALTQANFDPVIDSGSGELRVPSDQYHEARLLLASQGLPASASQGGFATLSQESTMTTSQFMEQVKYMNAIEQELAMSISQINSIQAARVHIASPKQSVFVRDRTPAKASVVVTPQAGRRISDEQVQAIVHIVSSSVPYLAASDVSVVDQRGNLLTDSSETDTALGVTAGQLAYQQKVEEIYRSRIDNLLSPIVGAGNVQSVVSVSLDFTQTESTLEQYDDQGRGGITRSEVISIDNTNSPTAGGVPGAASNIVQPPVGAAIGGATGTTPATGSSTVSNEPKSSHTTRNYELDRTVQHVKNAMGQVEKLSVAIVLNEKALSDKLAATSGQTVNQTMIDSEIARLTSLVEGIVAFDANRGDQVKVMASPFEEIVVPEIETSFMDNADLISIVQIAVAGIAFIAILLVVVRPAIATIMKPQGGNSGNNGGNGFSADQIQALSQGEATSRPAGRSQLSEQLLDTANTYDEKVALVRLLVSEDSGRVANVLKSMIKTA
jgi:flagellar M-ring protein FliF